MFGGQSKISRAAHQQRRVITFSDEVSMKERSDSIALDCDEIQQGHRDWKRLQAAEWKLHPALESVSRGASRRKSRRTAQARNWTRNETRRKPTRVLSDHQTFLGLTHQFRGTERKELSFRREPQLSDGCIMVMCPLGRSWYCGLREQDQRKKHRTNADRRNRLLGTLGLWMLERTKKRGSDF